MRVLATETLDLLASSTRSYRFRVELFDVLSTGAPTVTRLVAGLDTSVTHPTYYRDLTPFVRDGLTWEEPGDKRASRLSFQLMDYTNRFDPDAGADKAFMKSGQVVRLLEGDVTLEAADWVTTFTGHVRGQVGFEQDRRSLAYQASVVAYGRRGTPRYLKQMFTSRTYGRGTNYAEICLDIAREQMGLSGAELDRFPVALNKVTQFAANTIVDLTPLEAIDKILETVGLVSDFDGTGALRTYSRDIRRSPDLMYQSLDLVFSILAPPEEIEIYNSVSVTGLDKNITEVAQPEQELARATVPVGFWRPTHTVGVSWTKDNSLRARDTYAKVLTSINEAIMFNLGDESYVQVGEFGGEIVVTIWDFLLILLTVIALLSVLAFLVPDPVIVAGVGASTGETVPWLGGSLFQGAMLQTITYTLSINSSGVYEIWGVPLIPIFKEITSIVTETGVLDWALHQKEIHNDWLNTMEELTEVAKLELLWETSQARPRQIEVLDHWSLEVGDIIQLPIYGGAKYWVDALSKTIARETVPVLRISGFRVPEGV